MQSADNFSLFIITNISYSIYLNVSKLTIIGYNYNQSIYIVIVILFSMKKGTDTKKYFKASRKNPIIDFCWEKPRKIVEITKELNIKRSTLAYYLDNLKTKGLIKMKRIEERETGRPTLVEVNKAKIEKKEESYGDKFFIEENTLKVLTAIKNSKTPLTFSEVQRKANTSPDATYYLETADDYGLIETRYNLTKKGLAFLNQKRKYKPYNEVYPNDE